MNRRDMLRTTLAATAVADTGLLPRAAQLKGGDINKPRRLWHAALGTPVISGLMIGHIADKTTVPIGIMARLDADAGSKEVCPAMKRPASQRLLAA